MWFKNNWYKILCGALLLWGTTNHPYAYYQMLRWIVVIAGAYSAYTAYSSKKIFFTYVFAVMALLFNPIIPFYMKKETWQIFDFLAGLIFLASVFINFRNKENSNLI